MRLLPPLLALCAGGCATTGPITTTQDALPCWAIITASGLLEATTGAPLPGDMTGDLAAFGDRQTGQLDKANSDKAGVKRMGDACETYQQQAVDRAHKRNRPWWKVF